MIAAVALLTATAASANAHLIVGINDTAGYEATVPTWFFPTMQSEGLYPKDLDYTKAYDLSFMRRAFQNFK